MNISMIRYLLAYVLCFEGAFLTLPAMVGFYYGETKDALIYLGLAAVVFAIGILGKIKKPKSEAFFAKEGFVSVSLGWIVLSLVGAVPFVLTGAIPYYFNALFETISGFTTTGSSIIHPDVLTANAARIGIESKEVLTDAIVKGAGNFHTISHATLFWRSFTHWVGGMGVLVFIMAILPLGASSSIHMMKAESPGPSVGKFLPKAKNTAKTLYLIYIAITFIEMIALCIAGLTPFESSTLTFGTVGTGGFALLGTSIGSYSTAVQIIITVFMIVCSLNFTMYYLLLIRKPKLVFFDEELRWYFVLLIGAIVILTINGRSLFSGWGEAIQQSAFQVASISSTTGYGTVANFNAWPALTKGILLVLMGIGACAGSTGGGFKMSRLIIVLKSVKNEIVNITHPRLVSKVKMNKKSVANDIIKRTMAYLGAYVAILIVSVLIVSIDGHSVTTNLSAVMATLNNIGPGFDSVATDFTCYGTISKIVLMFDMLVGRLEIFPLLVLFSSIFSGTRLQGKRALGINTMKKNL